MNTSTTALWHSVTPSFDAWPVVFWFVVCAQVSNLLAFIFLLLLFKVGHRRGRWLHGTNCKGTFGLTALEVITASMTLLNLHLSYDVQHHNNSWSEQLIASLLQARSYWLGLVVLSCLTVVDPRTKGTFFELHQRNEHGSRWSFMSTTFQFVVALLIILLSGLIGTLPTTELFSKNVAVFVVPIIELLEMACVSVYAITVWSNVRHTATTPAPQTPWKRTVAILVLLMLCSTLPRFLFATRHMFENFAVIYWIVASLYPITNMAIWIRLNIELYDNIIAILCGHPLGNTEYHAAMSY